jgi:putative nucleotidyltransferase with HDIG domain
MKASALFTQPRPPMVLMLLGIGCVALGAEVLLGGVQRDLNLTARVFRTLGIWFSLAVLHAGARAVMSQSQSRDQRSHLTLYVLLITSIVSVVVVQVIGAALTAYAGLDKSPTLLASVSLLFLLPFTTGVLVLQSIRGLQLGLLSATSSAVLFGWYSQIAGLTTAMVLASSITACLVFQRGVRSRAAYLHAAMWISSAMLPFALISFSIVPPVSALDGAVRVLGCFVSGGLSALLAVAITPIIEYFGEYASDMRLIEMATLDHPLLKELSIQAPGTWNHSMVIGMMVESAAAAIGANPVVCRVGAYFHDVGKSKKPLYFVENQAAGENRHDKLSPSMSALIIRAHVKDGIDLARRYKLPKIIEDMIPQHHGTSVIDYFYDKARKEAEDAGGDPDTVDRSLYQYPGPRPQTKEAGLLMLADGIEAAARTLSDPSQDRIQGMVQKMLNKVFASGELNECELTLRDLHLIAKCFTRVLTGIYHQRIAYAEPAEKVQLGTDERGQSTGDSVAQKQTENLKRLGLE